jgi:hypothetical protein
MSVQICVTSLAVWFYIWTVHLLRWLCTLPSKALHAARRLNNRRLKAACKRLPPEVMHDVFRFLPYHSPRDSVRVYLRKRELIEARPARPSDFYPIVTPHGLFIHGVWNPHWCKEELRRRV